jgi:hypothetical protein
MFSSDEINIAVQQAPQGNYSAFSSESNFGHGAKKSSIHLR